MNKIYKSQSNKIYVSDNNKIFIKPLTELCFTANTAGSTVELYKMGAPSIANTAYSRDRITWTTFTPSETVGTNVVTLTNVGDKVYFRNDITGNKTMGDIIIFNMTGSISASGNVNSMYSSIGFNSLDTLSYNLCYYAMFYGCTSLTSAPELPAKNLSTGCYMEMFEECTSLISTPSLPATSLVTSITSECSCYSKMFIRCTSLVSVPILPATNLRDGCYDEMFSGCSSLYVSDTQTESAPYAWGIPNVGVFTTGVDFWQGRMFSGCLGTRSSNNMPGENGHSYTYYTQNQPI